MLSKYMVVMMTVKTNLVQEQNDCMVEMRYEKRGSRIGHLWQNLSIYPFGEMREKDQKWPESWAKSICVGDVVGCIV